MLQVGAAFAVWSVVAYACGVAVVWFHLGLSGPWTPGMTLLGIDALAVLTSFIVLGIGIGSRLSNVVIGPGLTAVGLLALSILDSAPDPIGRFSPIFASTFYTYAIQPNASRLVGLIVLLAGFAGLLFALGFYPRTTLRVRVAAGGALLLVGGAAQVLSTSSSAVEPRTGGPGTCGSLDGLELCVWPGPGVDVEKVLRPLVTARRAALSFRPVPTKFHEQGLRNGPGFFTIFVAAPTKGESYGPTAAAAMVPEGCDKATSTASYQLVGLLNELLRPGSMRDAPQPFSAGAALAHLSRAVQRAWAAPRLAALHACG